jgi:site-specific recombinase XerD
MKNIVISLYHDTRRSKKSGKFPVRLRLFNSDSKRSTFFPLKYDFSIEEYKKIWEVLPPGKRSSAQDKLNEERRLELSDVLTRARDIVKDIDPFTFEKFRAKFVGTRGNKINILYRFNEEIKRLNTEGRIGYAESYRSTLKSLKDFGNGKALTFYDITPDWLEKYERYMISNKRSTATVGIYLRNVRAVFNTAIGSSDINKDLYPFGDKKYIIPEGRNIKKALNESALLKLFKAKPKTPEQERAQAYWFFSYSSNGINMKDIALLKYTDISGSKFSFIRAKTKRAKKDKPTIIQGWLSTYAKSVIKKYGNKEKTGYVFPIITDDMSDKEKHRRVRNFTRSLNQGIKKVAKSAKITEDLSSYYARHSFSTISIRKGSSLEQVMEALGHSEPKTTINYFKGFEDNTIKSRNKKVMGFLGGD